ASLLKLASQIVEPGDLCEREPAGFRDNAPGATRPGAFPLASHVTSPFRMHRASRDPTSPREDLRREPLPRRRADTTGPIQKEPDGKYWRHLRVSRRARPCPGVSRRF